MRLPVLLFPGFFLLSITVSGRRRYSDTQACIRRDGYCKTNCNETGAVLELDLGTCANGKKRCCRPQDLDPGDPRPMAAMRILTFSFGVLFMWGM